MQELAIAHARLSSIPMHVQARLKPQQKRTREGSACASTGRVDYKCSTQAHDSYVPNGWLLNYWPSQVAAATHLP